jgi:hypothetical protein
MLKDLCRNLKDAAAKIKDAKDVIERPKMNSKDVRSQRRICSFADLEATTLTCAVSDCSFSAASLY